MSRSRGERGSVLVFVAVAMPVLILMTSFAVDLGRQRALRRDLQADADVISLDLIRLVEDPNVTPSDAETLDALNESLGRNGMATVHSIDGADGALVEWGTWVAPAPPQSCAVSNCFSTPAASVNAVRVTLDDDVDYLFRSGAGGASRSAVAAAGDDGAAEFLMGSTLVSMDPPNGWLLGQVLRTVVPGAELVGYGGLANAEVTLASLAAGLNLGSPEQLVDATVSYEQLLMASLAALEQPDATADDRAAAITALDDVLALTVHDFDVAVGDVLGLGSGAGAGLGGAVSVPQLLVSSIAVANGLQAIDIPSSQLAVDGLAGITLDLSAIEPLQRIGTHDGASGSTSQVDVGVDIQIDLSALQQQRICELPPEERTVLASLLGGVFQVLDCLLVPLAQAPLDVKIQGDIDLDLTVAEVTGTQTIDCAADRLEIAYDTGPVDLTGAASLSATVEFDLDPLDLIDVTAPTIAVSAAGHNGTVAFQPTDVGPLHASFEQVFPDGSTAGPSARIGAPTLGMSSLLNVSGLQVTVVDAELPELGAIASNLVVPMLNHLVDEVDRVVVAEISRLFGLNLGGADLTPQFLECDENGVTLVG